jgi:hypothetical protein
MLHGSLDMSCVLQRACEIVVCLNHPRSESQHATVKPYGFLRPT